MALILSTDTCIYTQMLETQCACAKLRRSARIVSALYDEALAPAGFTVAQFSLLRMLQRAGPCSLTEFAAATGHDRTTLNRTLRPLEQAGFVASSAARDGRARIVAVTEAARTAMRRGQPLWEQAQARIAGALGPDRDALFALLDRVEALRP
jgi:DNA-binding MarR family transcriptional regulator